MVIELNILYLLASLHIIGAVFLLIVTVMERKFLPLIDTLALMFWYLFIPFLVVMTVVEKVRGR